MSVLISLALLGQLTFDDDPVDKSNESINLIYDTNRYHPPEIMDINSDGWEDSAEVSWDAKQILFMYSPLDVGLFGQSAQIRLTTPRPQYTITDEDSTYRSDLLVAVDPNGTGDWLYGSFGSNINTPHGMEGSGHLGTGIVLFEVHLMFDRSQDGSRGLYNSVFNLLSWQNGWSNPTLLPEVINGTDPALYADNPHYKKGRLYYDKNTLDKGLQIYSVRWPMQEGDTPEPFTEINSDTNDTQLWVSPDAKEFWFCRDFAALYRYKDGEVVPMVFTPTNSLGEPSVTSNGDLYFIYVFSEARDGYTAYDADLVRMRKK